MSWMDKIKAAWGSKDETAFNAALAEAPKGETVSLTTEQLRTLNKLTADSAGAATTDSIKDAVFADKRFTDMAADVARIADAFEKKDEEEEEEDEEERKKKKETEDEENHTLEGNLEMEAPPGTGDKAWKAKDSAYLADSFQEAVALAEVIVPGMQVPTFDAKAAPAKTFDAICAFRKRVLDLAYIQPETRTFMDEQLGGRRPDQLTCDSARIVFRSVGAFKKRANNAASQDHETRPASGGGTGVRGRVKNATDLNKANAEYYAKQ